MYRICLQLSGELLIKNFTRNASLDSQRRTIMTSSSPVTHPGPGFTVRQGALNKRAQDTYRCIIQLEN